MKSISLLSLILVFKCSQGIGLREYESGNSKKFAHCQFLDGLYASVMRNIYNPGFHKDLATEVELMLTTSLLPEKCRIVLEETFPKGMYVDPDQLRDLKEFSGLKTYTSAEIDVEKPEFESEAFRLYVFKDLETQENLRLAKSELPVHLRYHKPRPPTPAEKKRGEQPVAIVKMQNPRLLLSCEEEDVVQHCPDRVVTTFCDSTGNTKCEYLMIPYKANVNAIEVSIPVGNVEQAPLVVGMTTLVVSGGTIYLMVALFRKT